MKPSAFLVAALFLGCGDGIVIDTTTGGGGGGAGTGTSGTGGACPERECPPGEPFPGKRICDDGDPKTVDRCVVEPCGGVCTNSPAECDGFDPPDVQKVVCDDSDPCTDDRCLPATNECVSKPAANGTRCQDGTCQMGVCVTR